MILLIVATPMGCDERGQNKHGSAHGNDGDDYEYGNHGNLSQNDIRDIGT